MRFRVRRSWIIIGLVLSGICLGLILKKNWNRPKLSPLGVVSAADYVGGKVAPGEIVVLYPSKAGPATLAEYRLGGNGRVSTSIAGTRVLFDGIPAPIFYAISGRIAVIVPYEVAKRTTTRVSVEYQGARSPAVTLPVVESLPALFTLDSSGHGQAAMLNQIGCCNSARNPAARGTIVTLYATGEGDTIPHGIDGNVAAYTRVADLPVPKQKLTVTVGSVPAEIIYAGEAPLAVAGLLQVNFRIPSDAPVGDAVPLVLTVGAAASPDGVTMAIKSAAERILVIEPQPAVRNRLTAILQAAGYQVTAAQDAGEVDLVACDLDLPESDVKAIQALRAQRPKLRVLAIAPALDPASLRRADLLGAQAVLTKPVTDAAVLPRVRRLLREVPLPYALEQESLPPMPGPR